MSFWIYRFNISPLTLFLHHRLDSGRREEAESLHRAERPPAQQAPPPRGAQPMAARQPEVSRGRQEVQNGSAGRQRKVRGQRRLV